VPSAHGFGVRPHVPASRSNRVRRRPGERVGYAGSAAVFTVRHQLQVHHSGGPIRSGSGLAGLSHRAPTAMQGCAAGWTRAPTPRSPSHSFPQGGSVSLYY
jgi:hypothetical protein